MKKTQEKVLHELFEITILLKGAYGIFEVFTGTLLLINRTAISDFLQYLVHGELLEDPTDRIANYVIHFSQTLSASTELFIGAYFLIYGLIKIFLVDALFHKKPWAYTSSVVFIGLFLIYQLYRVSHTHSITLTLLIIIDLFAMGLIWNEHKMVQRKNSTELLKTDTI